MTETIEKTSDSSNGRPHQIIIETAESISRTQTNPMYDPTSTLLRSVSELEELLIPRELRLDVESKKNNEAITENW